MPAPLRDLDAVGRATWERIWRSGAAWLSRHTDIELVQLVCEQHDDRTDLRKLVKEDAGRWRERSALRVIDKQIADNLSMLGFDPASRTRLGGLASGAVPIPPAGGDDAPPAEGGEQADELNAFRQRKATRAATRTP